MKKLSLLVIGLILGLTSMSQSEKDAIIGDWYNQDKDAVIQIYEDGGKYYGKIIWILNPLDENGKPKTDHLNPDESLRSNNRVGLVIMKGFEYDENNEWDNGNIYDPASGNDYSSYLTLTSKNKIDLRGYVGISLFGRTSTWTRKLN